MLRHRRWLDDAGEPAHVFRPRFLDCWQNHLPEGEFREIQASLRLECEAEPRPFLSLAWVLGVYLVLAVVMGVFRRESFMALMMLTAALVAWGRLYQRGFPTRSRVLIARALLDRYRCPSCIHSLTGVPADREGLSRCPECGASWRVGGILNAMPP